MSNRVDDWLEKHLINIITKMIQKNHQKLLKINKDLKLRKELINKVFLYRFIFIKLI